MPPSHHYIMHFIYNSVVSFTMQQIPAAVLQNLRIVSLSKQKTVKTFILPPRYLTMSLSPQAHSRSLRRLRRINQRTRYGVTRSYMKRYLWYSCRQSMQHIQGIILQLRGVLYFVCTREGAIYRLSTGGCYISFVHWEGAIYRLYTGRVLYIVCPREGATFRFVHLRRLYIGCTWEEMCCSP